MPKILISKAFSFFILNFVLSLTNGTTYQRTSTEATHEHGHIKAASCGGRRGNNADCDSHGNHQEGGQKGQAQGLQDLHPSRAEPT